MTDRRAFLQTLAAGAAVRVRARLPATAPSAPAGLDDRAYWLDVARRVADPVLRAAAAGRLKQTMPVEAAAGAVADRRRFSHLEALGRTLAGLAPWLALSSAGLPGEDEARRERADLARRAMVSATNPRSADALNFSDGAQPLVDAAFLAHAIVRAPAVLWQPLEPPAKAAVVASLKTTRAIRPPFNNWLLFAAMIEAALALAGEPADEVRIDYAIRQHAAWYTGDGLYGDGPSFHWDYYNSFVIHPMLLDILGVVGDRSPAWRDMASAVVSRARRYAAIQERLIGPDGSYPPIGRSLAYRCGAFHLLGQMALRHDLPDGVSAAQVRAAMTAVIRRTIEPPGTFDEHGWLTIGLCGHQPTVGEPYISTGSLYLCTTGLLPLGLPADDPFWRAPAEDWTARKAWAGGAVGLDHAID